MRSFRNKAQKVGIREFMQIYKRNFWLRVGKNVAKLAPVVLHLWLISQNDRKALRSFRCSSYRKIWRKINQNEDVLGI